MNLEQAQKATRNGAIAALLSAGVTFLVVTVAMMLGDVEELAVWNDPFNYLDVVLLLAFAFGIWKGSRFAAIAAFGYFLMAKIYLIVGSGQITGLPLALVILYYLGRAIQGSYVVQRHRAETEPGRWRMPAWMWAGGGALAIIGVLLMGLGAMSEVGVIPSTAVLEGSELPSDQHSDLKRLGVLEEDEEVRYFYSAGLLSIEEDGNILTDRRVISYETFEDELFVASVAFSDIVEIVVEEKGDYLNDTILLIRTRYEEDIYLFLSAEEEGDERFIEALETAVSRSSSANYEAKKL